MPRAEKFHVELELGNAAMITKADVQHALVRALSRANRRLERGHEGMIFDENGNSVGRWWCS